MQSHQTPRPSPRRVLDPEACVDAILQRVGREVVLGIPLGVGKPNHIVNALYRRAASDPSIQLTILTALSLGPTPPPRDPSFDEALEQRLRGPLEARIFEGYPRLEYEWDLASGRLPDNVTVTEFFFAPGAMLSNPRAQQRYTSLNYTHVLEHVTGGGGAPPVNVLAQLVSPDDGTLSLSSNPDIGVDLLPVLHAADRPTVVCGQVNRLLPFLPGPAERPESDFDIVLDAPNLDFPLTGPPHEPIEPADHRIGLLVSALVHDGGTIQLGIGALSDAVTHALTLRHRQPDAWRDALRSGPAGDLGELVPAIGGDAPFERGLTASTEMFVPGLLELYRAGVLARKVHDNHVLQRLLDDEGFSERVTLGLLTALRERGVEDPDELRRLGVLRPSAPDDLDRVTSADLGDRLAGGALVQAAFFLGPRDFYPALRELSPTEREAFRMTAVSFTNALMRDTELKMAQRRHARFINTAMLATTLGAVTSDGLEDGRVISGVGGQYNFVAMAHELPEARSILMVRATRESGGDVESNVRTRYGHTTIPRHLRDIVVTEYGVADLRGRSDAEVIDRMIRIADSRFQAGLIDDAKRAGKLPAGYELPDRYRENTPERIADHHAAHADHLPELPFGTDLTAVELDLLGALEGLKRGGWPDLTSIGDALTVPDAAEPYLERMGLADPSGVRERLMRATVVYALSSAGVL